MSTSTSPSKVGKTETETVPNQPDVSFLTIRGKIYRIEELENGKYEDLQRAAEIPNPKDADEKVTDMIVLNRLVTLSSVTIVEKVGDPAGTKLDADAWAKEKIPVVSRVQYEVRRAHYMTLTDEEMAAADEADRKAASPNA